MNYLEEAATQLRKALAETETLRSREINDAPGRSTQAIVAEELIRDRERIADAFARLAAIEKGLLPGNLVGELAAHLSQRNEAR